MEAQKLADYCRKMLNFTDMRLGEEYGYGNLVLCVIDAIYSIGVTYTSTRNTVARFQTYLEKQGITLDSLSISVFCELLEQYSVEAAAKDIFQNRQRTSSTNGILKAEAVLRIARILRDFGVEHLSDIEKIFRNSEFEAAFRQVPGQKSGISLSYFYMLVGSEDDIKPDRMVVRFLESALNRSVKVDECHDLLLAACEILQADYPKLTLRDLDHAVWQYQRDLK